MSLFRSGYWLEQRRFVWSMAAMNSVCMIMGQGSWYCSLNGGGWGWCTWDIDAALNLLF